MPATRTLYRFAMSVDGTDELRTLALVVAESDQQAVMVGIHQMPTHDAVRLARDWARRHPDELDDDGDVEMAYFTAHEVEDGEDLVGLASELWANVIAFVEDYGR